MAKSSAPNDGERRSSVDWRARQKKQKIAGVFKLFVVVAILGVLVGLGIVFKAKIMAMIETKQPETTVKQAPPPPPPVVEQKPAAVKTPEVVEVKKPVEPALEPPKAVKAVEPERTVSAEDEARAKKLIEEGLAALNTMKERSKHGRKLLDFDFDGARTKFEEARGLMASKETHAQAEEWVKKINEFDLATEHIGVTEFAAAEQTISLQLSTGYPAQGIEMGQDADNLKLQVVSNNNPAAEGRQVMSFPLKRILKKESVSRAQRQEHFRQLVSELESGSNMEMSSDGTAYYDLVFLSKRLGLVKETMLYLDRAYARTADGLLANAFRKLVIDRALERAALHAAAGRKHFAESTLKRMTDALKGYQVALDEADAFRATILSKIGDDFKSTLTMKERAPEPEKKTSAKQLVASASAGGDQQEDLSNKEIVVDSSGVTGKGAAAGIVDQANAAYEEGMACYRQFRQGTKGNNNETLKKAADLLDKAITLYDQALQKDPGNKAIEDRQTEANMIRYACLKYQTLR
ncbi:MAG: hypothetical protein L6R28_24595 [Planctomycetes bacterium]|nr:hypothetical protein [Planctomycetota bacterium]